MHAKASTVRRALYTAGLRRRASRMSHHPTDRQPTDFEVLTHARRIAGGLAALGMRRSDTLAVLMHHDPLYLSVIHACRSAGCRILHISPHATREQIAFALQEQGIRVLFVHDYFLSAIAEPSDDITLIAVTPPALFPEADTPRQDGRRHHAYHHWLALQEERDAPLGAARGRRPRTQDGVAVSGTVIGKWLVTLAKITAGAGDPPPPADEA